MPEMQRKCHSAGTEPKAKNQRRIQAPVRSEPRSPELLLPVPQGYENSLQGEAKACSFRGTNPNAAQRTPAASRMPGAKRLSFRMGRRIYEGHGIRQTGA